MAQKELSNILPGKYRFQWIWIFLGNVLILWLLMVGPRIGILHSRLSVKNLGAFLILAAILSFLPGIAGFLGNENLFWFGSAGNLTGIILMLVFLLRGGGWEDITSLLVLIEFSLLGLAIGGLLEIVLWFYRRVRRRSEK